MPGTVRRDNRQLVAVPLADRCATGHPEDDSVGVMRIAFDRQQRAAVTRHLGDFASAIGKTERALGAAQVGQASAAEADLDLASLRSEIGRQPHITFALFPSEPSPA